ADALRTTPRRVREIWLSLQGHVDRILRFRNAACEFAGVSTTAYYDWAAKRDQGPSARAQRDSEVLAEIRAIHKRHPDYGAPRVHP
ncbi:MAG: hypothetical protein ACR2KP_02280, partial [Egibacteraceae bacterium]